MVHNHKHCIESAIREAIMMCDNHGVRLTPIRRKILELIWQTHKPIKAYELLAELDQADGANAPPTVYRAIDFLRNQGLIHKIESLNAYTGCLHPKQNHGCQIFICTSCDNVTELCHEPVVHSMLEAAKNEGYRVSEFIIEMRGLCPQCQ